MEKVRSEIDNKYKWKLEDIIKDDETYKEMVTEAKMLISKIVGMKDEILKSSNNLLMYLKTDEELSKKVEKINRYSYLYYYQDMMDTKGKEYKDMADKLFEEMSTKLSFVRPLLLSCDYEIIRKYIKENKELEKFAFALERIFRYKKYTLSEKEERIIANANNAMSVGPDVFEVIDNVDIDLGYIKDENNEKVKLTNSNYVRYCSSKNRSVRKNAFKNMYAFFGKFINTISACYIGSIKENAFNGKIRGYNSYLEARLYPDDINVDFYKEFIDDIHRYIPLLQRYMKVRNKYLGYKSHLYDVYVDLGFENANIPYENGKKYVLDALKPLGKQYVDDLALSFKNGWIDVYPNLYKRSGAFETNVYKLHPYVSLNYENNYDSVSTLAHELGHAMHSFYSDKNNDYNYADYPIFLAEIASTVNEALIDDYFYKQAKNDEEKIYYLSSFLDKVRTTVFRQVMFAEFETKAYEMYENNETLTTDVLCNIYYELNKTYFGKSIIVDEEIKYEWARIPHFYTPFYVYKYATGLITALAITGAILNDDEEMRENYLKFLAAGNSDYPLETLKKCNIDLSDKKFIKNAFNLFKEKLEELESLVDKKVS